MTHVKRKMVDLSALFLDHIRNTWRDSLNDEIVVNGHTILASGSALTVGYTVKVHQTVTIGKNVRMGSSCRVGKKSWLGDNSQLFDNCLIGKHTKIGAGAEIGQYVTVEDEVFIGAEAVIGSYIHIGAMASVGDGAVLDMCDHIPRLSFVPARSTGAQCIGFVGLKPIILCLLNGVATIAFVSCTASIDAALDSEASDWPGLSTFGYDTEQLLGQFKCLVTGGMHVALNNGWELSAPVADTTEEVSVKASPV